MPNQRNLWQPGIRGNVLREARIRRGLTMRELAAEATAQGIRVDFSNIGKAELTGKGLGLRKIAALLAFLDDITPGQLIDGYHPEMRTLLEALGRELAAKRAAAA